MSKKRLVLYLFDNFSTFPAVFSFFRNDFFFFFKLLLWKAIFFVGYFFSNDRNRLILSTSTINSFPKRLPHIFKY